MSYILEALRKAERERNLGQAPNLNDVTHAPPAPSAQRRPWLLVTFATLIVLLAAALLWSWRREPAQEPIARTAAPAPSTTAAAPPAAAAIVPAPAPAAAVNAPPAIENSESVATLDDLYPAETETGPAAPPAPIVSAPPPPAPAPSVAPTAQEAAIAAEVSAAVEEQNRAGTQAEPDKLQLDPAPAGTGTGAKTLKEMPAGYRADFPQLSVDVHVSNADPQKRFTLINGRRYREGDALPEGPRIVEIIEDGIVFDYRGERVKYSLPR